MGYLPSIPFQESDQAAAFVTLLLYVGIFINNALRDLVRYNSWRH